MNEKPTHIDLFSGIGGFALAAQWTGFRTVAFCEIDAYCQAIIKARFGAVMADPNSGRQQERQERNGEAQQDSTDRDSRRRDFGGCSGPVIHGDIRTIDGTRYRGADLLTGGFPCQPFSVAGKRAGAADDRFLWPEMLRVIDEARPAWVLGENVAGIVQMELDRVLSDLESLGYACWPLVIPACAVDARHRRDRVWIVGHANEGGLRRARTQGSSGHVAQSGEALADSGKPGLAQRQEQPTWKEQSATERGGCALADTNGNDGQRGPGYVQMGRERGTGQAPNYDHTRGVEWLPEPDVGRVAHGVSKRVDRLKGLGNAIVPQVAFEMLRTIRQLI